MIKVGRGKVYYFHLLVHYIQHFQQFGHMLNVSGMELDYNDPKNRIYMENFFKLKWNIWQGEVLFIG